LVWLVSFLQFISSLSVLKGQTWYFNVLKWHLLMILILWRIFYNTLSAKKYIMNVRRELVYKVIKLYNISYMHKREIMAEVLKFVNVMIIFLFLVLVAMNVDGNHFSILFKISVTFCIIFYLIYVTYFCSLFSL